jgi:hypothetical protein
MNEGTLHDGPLGRSSRDERAPRRGLFLAAAAVVTAGGLAVALWLGSWAFDLRRFSVHVGRLERLLAKEPKLDIVVQAFEEEGTPLAARADSLAELQEVAERLAGRHAPEVVEKGTRFAHTRVFGAPDMLYFVYFDADRTMRSFTCVSR